MKLLVKTAASTAVVLVALAGCASRSSGSGTSAAGGGSTSSAPSDGTTSTQNGSQPPTPGSSGSSGETGGQQSGPGSQPGGGSPSSKPSTDPSALVKYVSPDGVSVAQDGITLVTEVQWGGCDDQPQLVVVSQDASKVVVELKKTSHARIGMMCPDIARTGQATVKLAAPLGARPVVDGVKNVPITTH
ncbi:MAG: hypothetical protein HOV83_13585 [Catenulispora sp.]|nr:hypothetical protein [Catenulispora sp.]